MGYGVGDMGGLCGRFVWVFIVFVLVGFVIR